jgi:hypothetical protein
MHHSTLLYATPPSSIACLDLLVGLYGWVGGILGETPKKPDPTMSLVRSSIASIKYNASDTGTTTTSTLKTSLSTSLETLSDIRGDLLRAWALRNEQTTQLEDEANRRQAEIEGTPLPTLGVSASPSMTPISSSGVEYRKGQKRMPKIHRSVGGRLRDLLTHSGSSNSISAMAIEKASRMSVDGGMSRSNGSEFTSRRGLSPILHEKPEEVEPMIRSTLTRSPTVPSTSPRNTPPRPTLGSRHSIQSPRGEGYISPFIARTGDYDSPFESTPDLRLGVGRIPSIGMKGQGFGGVGGVSGMGDEDERREEVGRKKEGVLWGAGSWEGLTKGGGKGKWESQLCCAE